MTYLITEKLLPPGTNRPGTLIHPIGVVIHETATPGALASREYEYFAGGNRNASAHYFVDDVTILRVIPENEMAWHAGPTANKKYLSIEMCHFDGQRFKGIWDRTVWLAADMCRRYGWDPGNAIVSHEWVSKTYRESTHTDPLSYFANNGKKFEDLIEDVKKAMSKPEITKNAAQKIINILGAVWQCADGNKAVQDAANYAADALRDAAGLPKQ